MLVTMTQRVKNRKDAKFEQDLSKTNKDVAPQKSQPVQQAFPVASRVIARKLEWEHKKGEGEGRRETLSYPSPVIPFFSLSSQFPRRIRMETMETLATQATKVAEFHRCLYAGRIGGKLEHPPYNFVAFWSSMFAHFKCITFRLATFKVSYSSFKAIFPAVSMDICSVVLIKT